ncbi:unnamed protein product [Colias eurytheme]|nr:unnamed protein product [Colias eurytheme]
MLHIKCCFVLLCVHIILSSGQPRMKFFRKDYHFIESTGSFYKIQTIHKNWDKAKEKCEMEGATLFYPDDDDEAEAVLSFWNETQPFSWVFIGVSALNVPEVFETVDGIPIAEVYDRWGPGEPNNAGGKESCVIMRRDGTLNDDQCSRSYPYICKKTLGSLEWNNVCDIPDTKYEYSEKLGRCYKFHSTPMKWTDAYVVCSAEQSYLAIIDSQEEADHLANLTNNANKDIGGDFLGGAVHLGFVQKNEWRSIKGMPFKSLGYTRWGNGQPDGGEREKCGSMFYNGKLNDINCDVKCFFICEHEISFLESAINPRFGDYSSIE